MNYQGSFSFFFYLVFVICLVHVFHENIPFIYKFLF